MPTILLAIDAYTRLERLLPPALLLASQQQARLLGMFAQDTRLLQGAALPCTQEVGANSAVCYPLTTSTIQMRVQRIAEDMRRRLAAAAERQQLPWEFQLCYGSISQITSDAQAEVVLPGWSEKLWISRHAGFSTQNTTARPVIVVIDDGSSSAAPAIEAARRLSGPKGPKQLVILTSNSGIERGPMPLQAVGEGTPRELKFPVATSPVQLLRQLRLLRPTLLLLGREQQLASDSQLQKELSLIQCPVALLRSTT